MPDSTILVKGEGWKFKAAIGLGGLAVIVILAFLYRLEVGLIVLAIGSAVGARMWIWAIHQHRLAGFERRRLLAEVLAAEYKADRERLMRHFLEFNAGVFHVKHPDEIVEVKKFYAAVSAAKPFADMPALLPEPEPPVKRLLDIRFDHILIVGPTRSGKTTVANHLIDNAEYDATIYALDPHATQNRLKGLSWSPRAQVVGDGRDWAAIDAMLVHLLGEMNERFQHSTVPQPVYVANDEWLAVLKNCPHAKEFFEIFGSEAAKVNMHLIIVTQAATVDDLGVSGDVRGNLIELRLSHESKAENKGQLRWGRGRDTVETVELPGPYRAYAPVPKGDWQSLMVRLPDPVEVQEAIETETEADPIPLAPTGDELKVCELWEKGASLRAIWKEVYGTEFGGNQADKIKGILVKWGRVIQ